MKKKQAALGVLVGCIVIAMLAGSAAVLVPSRYIDYRLMNTVIMVGVYAIGGLVVVAASGKMRRTFRLCILTMLISMVIFLFDIWFDQFLYSTIGWRWEERIQRVGQVSLFLSLTLGHRLLVFPLMTPFFVGKVAKRSALISVSILCIVGSVWLINDGFWKWEELVSRLMMIFSIIGAGTTMAAGALAIFGPKPGDDEPGLLGASMPVSMTCPRCQSAVEAQSNRESRCSSCRLKIRVEVEEPRCSCGYLLYELESDICPECGKEIEGQDRWAGAMLDKVVAASQFFTPPCHAPSLRPRGEVARQSRVGGVSSLFRIQNPCTHQDTPPSHFVRHLPAGAQGGARV